MPTPWSAPTGWPSIWTRPTCAWWTPPGSCPTPAATPAPSTRPRTSRVPCSSTSTRSRRDQGPASAHGARVPPSSAPGCASWASATAPGSSSTTTTASSPRPGSGGCCASWATPTSTVLDGGLAKWQAEGRPVDDLPAQPAERHFTARQNNLLLPRARPDAREPDHQARAGGRRPLRRPLPRAASRSRAPGLRGGHIPGSTNLPYADLIAADGTLQARGRAAPAPRRGRRRPRRGPIVTSCGSGVSAARDQPRPVRARRAATPPSTTARGPSGARRRTRRWRDSGTAELPLVRYCGEASPPPLGRS